MRFKQGETGGFANTTEAMAEMQAEKQKRIERAARFGIETKETKLVKIKQRQERFGIEAKETKETKETLEAKR